MAEVSKNTSYKGSRQTCTWEGHLSREKKAAAHSPYRGWWTWCKPSKEVRLSHGRGFLTPGWNLLSTGRALVKETLLSYLAALTVLSQTGLLVLVDMGCKEPETFLPARVTSPSSKPRPMRTQRRWTQSKAFLPPLPSIGSPSLPESRPASSMPPSVLYSLLWGRWRRECSHSSSVHEDFCWQNSTATSAQCCSSSDSYEQTSSLYWRGKQFKSLI